MSLLKPRRKPTPGRNAEDFFGHRLSMFYNRDQATCAYCGEIFSGIMLEIAAGAEDEESSPVRRCRAAARAGT